MTGGMQGARHRMLAVIAGIVMVMIVLGISSARPTLADWTASQSPHGAFTAGRLGSVQNLRCVPGGLGGLLGSQVRFDWTAPAVPSGVAVEYGIQVDRRTLTGSTRTVVVNTTTTSTSYTFDSGSALLQSYRYGFTVVPKIVGSQWTGTALTSPATKLLGLAMTCT